MDRRRFFKTAGLSALAVAAEMTPLSLKGSELFYASETSNRETNSNKTMKHKCKITVLKRECYQDLQGKYNDNFFRMLHGSFCSEAWDCISRYVYAALQGGSIMRGWTNDEKMMITCCNDGTRPVIFKLERIDEEE